MPKSIAGWVAFGLSAVISTVIGLAVVNRVPFVKRLTGSV